MGKTAKRQRHDDEAATTKGSPDKSQAPAEKRLPAEERSSPGKENAPLNSQERGADKRRRRGRASWTWTSMASVWKTATVTSTGPPLKIFRRQTPILT